MEILKKNFIIIVAVLIYVCINISNFARKIFVQAKDDLNFKSSHHDIKISQVYFQFGR